MPIPMEQSPQAPPKEEKLSLEELDALIAQHEEKLTALKDLRNQVVENNKLAPDTIENITDQPAEKAFFEIGELKEQYPDKFNDEELEFISKLTKSHQVSEINFSPKEYAEALIAEDKEKMEEIRNAYYNIGMEN